MYRVVESVVLTAGRDVPGGDEVVKVLPLYCQVRQWELGRRVATDGRLAGFESWKWF